MERLVLIALLCIGPFLFIPQEHEEKTSPLIWDLTGIWMAEDSASIELLRDGTCQVKFLDLSKFTSLHPFTKKQVDFKGVWDYKFFFNRFSINDRNDKKLLILLKDPESGIEYNFPFSIKGQNGLFKNQEPWVLYTREGTWFHKKNYEFRKKWRE